MSELKIMTHLGPHLNIVNLLGACTKSGEYNTQKVTCSCVNTRHSGAVEAFGSFLQSMQAPQLWVVVGEWMLALLTVL